MRFFAFAIFFFFSLQEWTPHSVPQDAGTELQGLQQREHYVQPGIKIAITPDLRKYDKSTNGKVDIKISFGRRKIENILV